MPTISVNQHTDDYLQVTVMHEALADIQADDLVHGPDQPGEAIPLATGCITGFRAAVQGQGQEAKICDAVEDPHGLHIEVSWASGLEKEED